MSHEGQAAVSSKHKKATEPAGAGSVADVGEGGLAVDVRAHKDVTVFSVTLTTSLIIF